jgi:hypothetical protein
VSADGSRAGRIRAKVRSGIRITKADAEFLAEYDRRRDKRGRKTDPLPPVQIEDTPTGDATPTSAEQGTAPAVGATPSGPSPNAGPPPLSVATPQSTPSSATPAVKKPAANKPVVPTAIGKQIAALFTKGMKEWGAKIEERGGAAYPDELITVSAISAAWLADKYLGALGEEEALHWLNVGVPIGWNLWFGRKGATKPKETIESTATSTDAGAKSADGPTASAPESKNESTASIPRDPPPANPIAYNPSAAQHDIVKAAMGIGGTNDSSSP